MPEYTNDTDTVNGGDVAHYPETCLDDGHVIAGRYVIRGKLGKGGSATVYRAFDRQLGIDIALKVLRPEASQTTLRRFFREVSLSRRIVSSSVVRVIDIGADGARSYLTMELIEGESVRDRLRRGPLPIVAAARIGRGILEGVAALHAAKIMHRDIKPENVLIAGEAVKVADLGLVRTFEDELRTTASDAVVGTLHYVTPEQLAGAEVDFRSDLYAVGLVMFEMLAGKTPFAASSSIGIALSRVHTPAPDVRTLRPDAPPWLANIIGRLLEREPHARYSSAGAVIAALDRRKEPTPPSVTRKRRISGAVVLLVLAAALGAVVVSRVRAGRQFSHLIAPAAGGIAAISASGSTLWERRDVDPSAALRWALVRRVAGERPEIAVVLNAPSDVALDHVRRLSFVDPESGSVTRTVLLPGSVKHFPRSPARFYPGTVYATDLNQDGVDEVVTWFGHVPEWASFVDVYDPRTDRARIVFEGYGQHGIGGLFDLNRDGRKELILFGHNNGLGWYNVLAALRLDGGLTGETDQSPDFPAVAPIRNALLWYTLLPRGHHADVKDALVFDEKLGLFTIRYGGGEIFTVTSEGFLPGDRSPLRPAQRQLARFDAYAHLRDGRRLSHAGVAGEAIEELDAAVAAGHVAADAILVEAMRTERAEIFAAAGRGVEAERYFNELIPNAYYPAEIAYDAARAFHLAGDLDRALAWYRKGLALRAGTESGKSIHEFLQGIVFVYAERHAWAAGVAEVERFRRTFSNSPSDTNAIYREFLNWRAGGVPAFANIEIPYNATDLTRYWILEFRRARGDDPRAVLHDVQQEIATGSSETQSGMWSLKADLLDVVGRKTEAKDAIEYALTLLADDIAVTPIARVHADIIRARAVRLGGHG
jgi:tetratricopeptide (TPR) repeat protein